MDKSISNMDTRSKLIDISLGLWLVKYLAISHSDSGIIYLKSEFWNISYLLATYMHINYYKDTIWTNPASYL